MSTPPDVKSSTMTGSSAMLGCDDASPAAGPSDRRCSRDGRSRLEASERERAERTDTTARR